MVFAVLFIVLWFLVTVYNTLIKRDYFRDMISFGIKIPVV